MPVSTKAWKRGRDSINIVLWVESELGPYINAICCMRKFVLNDSKG
jgi:hypothetical protein